ncbi:hypothetical protein Agub_g3971 [Astrephomene gubernaculifera]|uniref:CSC1/OSCA1-like cytosolic domain-containing protein n=1 Tax=Astrephomene gubernaculifera TaxID=47775 RepID=A0AAD3DM47_9CHLO|nr:hypothetical protein Agub_g3971 [Astrephomene gubernaculifera]
MSGGRDKPGCVEACMAALRTKYRPSASVLEEYGTWKPPNENEAREKFVQEHTHHEIFDMKTPITELKEFGEGILLYFYLLKYTAMLFAVLAIFPGMLLMVFNGLGGWYDRADIERTTLGNYGLLSYNGRSSELNITTSAAAHRAASSEGAVTALFQSTVTATPAHVHGMNKRSLLVAMTVLDMLGVLLFFGYSAFMIWFVRVTARAADRNTTTIKDYAVRVAGGLPPDTGEEALQEYLVAAAGEGAEIVQVELCRKVDSLLALVLERGVVVQQLERARAELQRTAETYPKVPVDLEVELLAAKFRLDDLNQAIKQEQALADKHQVVTAFVTFATAEARYRAMEALPRSRMRQLRMPADKKFDNKGVGRAAKRPAALDVSAAPEPSDIQYENLEYTKLHRLVRRLFTNAAKYIVLLIGFLLVSLAPALRMGLSSSGSGPSKAACEASCTYTDAAGNYVLSDSARSLYKGCDSQAGTGALPNKLDCEEQSVCYECFCRAALSGGLYGELVYCSRFSSVVAVATSAQVLAVLGIVVANAMIEYAIGWLTRQEKHHTRSRQAVSMARGLFITQFVNTAFSNLLANLYLPGPAKSVSGSFLAGYIFAGSYADTTPNWFHDVGRPIVISIAVNTAILHIKVLFRWWWRRRCVSSRYRCLTQAQLNKAYSGHDFELSLKYGQHLYVLFVVMTYSGGMPVMYLLAAVHFASAYWSEKFELLRVCKRPLAYSRDLADYVSTTIPFAALWHLTLATWMYGLFGSPKSALISSTFRRGLESVMKTFKGLMASASTLTPALVAWRFIENSTAHLFIALIACSGALFVFFTLSGWLAAMRWFASSLGLTKDSGTRGEVEYTSVPEFGVAVRSQLLLGPATYSVQQNPMYAHAFVRMDDFDWGADPRGFTTRAFQQQQQAEAGDAAQGMGGGGGEGGGSGTGRQSKRKRTAAGRLRAKRQAEAAAAAGWAAEERVNNRYPPALGVAPALPSFGRNKVAPVPLSP